MPDSSSTSSAAESLIAPFAALRATPAYAQAIIAPPYDVVSTVEARALATAHSFLHVSRPEIDFPDSTNPYAEEIYQHASRTFANLLLQHLTEIESEPCLYVYGMTQSNYSQFGLACAVSLSAYRAGRVRRHELTRPEKEDDRLNHIEHVSAHTGPALLASRDDEKFLSLLEKARIAPPLLSAQWDGTHHQIWKVPFSIQNDMVNCVENFPLLYVADGHHRISAAARLYDKNPACSRFLGVIFPAGQMHIQAYHRVVKNLAGMSEDAFLQALQKNFSVSKSSSMVTPQHRGEMGLCLQSGWYRLQCTAQSKQNDVVNRLDVSLLTDLILAPVLGITDLRRDPRIEFVGGRRGVVYLETLVKEGAHKAAFALYPTSMAELMEVADLNALMPPKSTWFEPKLADGLLSLPL